MSTIPPFAADYKDAWVVPANMDNVYAPAGHGGVPNRPRAFIIHTPEEAADNIEVTPTWFQQYHPDRRGSTHYYLDNDGDVYQCVPEAWGAIANGFNPGNPQRLAYPLWAEAYSLNWQTLSVEVEGYAGSIAQTLNAVQFDALVRLVRDRCQHYGIPLDREHIMGHYQLAVDRTDPGAGFPWDRFMEALQGGRVYSDQDIDAKIGAVLGAIKDCNERIGQLQNLMKLVIPKIGLPEDQENAEINALLKALGVGK